jgi:hypothetical protein
MTPELNVDCNIDGGDGSCMALATRPDEPFHGCRAPIAMLSVSSRMRTLALISLTQRVAVMMMWEADVFGQLAICICMVGPVATRSGLTRPEKP